MRDLETLRAEFVRGEYLEPKETYELLARTICDHDITDESHCCSRTFCEHTSYLGCRCPVCYSDRAPAYYSESLQGYDSAIDDSYSEISLEECDARMNLNTDGQVYDQPPEVG